MGQFLPSPPVASPVLRVRAPSQWLQPGTRVCRGNPASWDAAIAPRAAGAGLRLPSPGLQPGARPAARPARPAAGFPFELLPPRGDGEQRARARRQHRLEFCPAGSGQGRAGRFCGDCSRARCPSPAHPAAVATCGWRGSPRPPEGAPAGFLRSQGSAEPACPFHRCTARTGRGGPALRHPGEERATRRALTRGAFSEGSLRSAQCPWEREIQTPEIFPGPFPEYRTPAENRSAPRPPLWCPPILSLGWVSPEGAPGLGLSTGLAHLEQQLPEQGSPDHQNYAMKTPGQ